MKYYRLLFVFILFVVACGKQNDVIKTTQWNKEGEILLPVVDYYNTPWAPTIIKTDTADMLLFYQNSSILVYNLTKQKLISHIEFNNVIAAADFKSLDSIFVLFSFDDYSYDSCFVMINSKGEIIKTFDFDFQGIWKKYFLTDSLDSVIYVENMDYLYFINDDYYFSIQKLYYNYVNDKDFNAFKYPIIGHFNLKSEKFFFDSIFNYPDLNKNELLQKAYAWTNMISVKNKIIIGFSYTPSVYIYDTKTKQTEIKHISSFLVDTLTRVKDESPFEVGNVLTYFFYDKYNKILYRAVFRHDTTDTFIMMDSNFNVIGETILPKNFRRPLITKDFYYSVNLEKTFSSDSKLVIDKYSVPFREINKDTFILENKVVISQKEQSENCTVIPSHNDKHKISLLVNHLSAIINKTNYAAIIVPVFLSCHNCVDILLTNYQVNLDYFANNNVYLVAVGENVSGIKNKLTDFEISTNIPTVIIDSSDIYENSFAQLGLEHLIIVQNDEVIRAQSYYPDEIDSLLNEVVNFAKQQNN